MTSVRIGYATTEIRSTRTVGTGDDRQTIRVRPGRGNARRAAIAESMGYDR